MSAGEQVYVDPDVKALLDDANPDAPDFWELSPTEARRASDDMIAGMLPPVEVGSCRDILIEESDLRVRARLYLPAGVTAPALLVFFHGGGWEIGSIEVSERPLRRLVVDSGCAVLSVDYRLAPEDPFPAGLEDCLAATRWASANRAALGVRVDFLAVGGDSAGANLAAAVAQRFRDDDDPAIDHQLLIYPVVQRRFDTPSYEAFGSGYFLTRATMRRFWELYLGPGDDAPPYADLFANGPLAGLPEATVLTAGLDPLRDEGELYAHALAAAGVPVTLVRVSGVIHGIWYMDATGDRAFQFGLDVAGALWRASSRAPSL
jgi:acetyl esterase